MLLEMQKILRNKKVLLCGFLPDLMIEKIDFEKYKKARGLFIEDPVERVKSIFKTDDFGNWHPDLVSAIQMAQFGAVVGILFGGPIESAKKVDNFIRTNDTNLYINKREAFKVLHNTNILATMKGAFKWSPVFAIFIGSFSLVSSCCELYRNKIGILDNTIAGAAVGALHKFMFGIKGMISGGLVGGVLGTLYGFTLWSVGKLSKTDQIEIKYSQYAFTKYYREMRKYNKTAEDEENIQIIKSGFHHMHDSDPLDKLEDTIKEEEKN